jgi:hypothetical protein
MAKRVADLQESLEVEDEVGFFGPITKNAIFEKEGINMDQIPSYLQTLND